MKHAIKILEEELNRPLPEIDEDEEDLVDAVISFRKSTDLKLAIKLLKQAQENADEIYKLNY